MKYILSIIISCTLLLSLSADSNAQVNAGVSQVLDPVSGSTLIIGSTFPVTAEIFNSGNMTITSMQVKFNIGINNTNTALDEIWTGSLAPGDTMNFTFAAQFTLNDTSDNSTYCLADAPGDTDPFNNSAYPVYVFAGVTGLHALNNVQKDLSIDELLVIPGERIQLKLNLYRGRYAHISLINLEGKTMGVATATGPGTCEIALKVSFLHRDIYILVVENEYGRLTEKILF